MSETPSTSDQWKLIEPHLLLSPVVALDMVNNALLGLLENDGFVGRLEDKFAKGASDHNGQWLSMNHEELIHEACEELLDMFIYIAMYACRASMLAESETLSAE